MSVTATKARTIRDVLNTSKEGEMDDALKLAQLGNMLVPMKYTVSGLVGALAAVDITSAAVAAAAVAGPFSPALNTPDDITHLPAALGAFAVSVRVTAGAPAAGPRIMTDAGGTPDATHATLSDDGKTITFEAAGVTGFVIEYMPRAAANLLNVFAPQL
jgi:hypothetical protein